MDIAAAGSFEQEDRNRAIARARAEGASLALLSDQYGVSVTRISRIVKREKEREAARQVRSLLRDIPEDIRNMPAERVLMMYDALTAITGNRMDLEDLAREWGVRGSPAQLPRMLARAALSQRIIPSPPPPAADDTAEDLI